MKYLIWLLLLTGCKDHKQELTEIKKRADLFCSCRGGIKELKVYNYNSIDDSGHVECNNGELNFDVESIEFACGKDVK